MTTDVETTLFGQRERNDPSPSSADESMFEFYDRVNDSFFNEIRVVLNQWFSRYPAKSRPSLKARIMSADEEQFISATWELYLHERFTAAGLYVEVDPELPSGLTPDFRLLADGRTVAYVEAAVAHPSSSERRQQNARAVISNELKRLVAGCSHSLLLQTESIGPKTPSLKAFASHLDDAMQAHPDGFRTAFVDDGWLVSIEAHPLGVRSPRLLVSESWGGVSTYDESRLDPIRKPLVKKGKKYRKLDAPLVVALTTYRHRSPVQPEDIGNAFFGSFTAIVDEGFEVIDTRNNNDGVLRQGTVHENKASVR